MKVSTLLFGFWLSLWAHGAQVVVGTDTKPKCGVYLAPSTIPGAGLGMFAGDHFYAEGDRVTFGDIAIPIIEYEWNNRGGEFEGLEFLWDEYTWNSPVFPGMELEGEDDGLIQAASPGVGAAANSYLSLVNVDDVWTQTDRGVHTDSPGVGATSPYHGREFVASADIPEGGEIWANYGEGYFKWRTQTYGYLPLPETFEMTDMLLERYLRLKNSVDQRSGAKGDAFWKDMYSIVRRAASTYEISRVLNGLPEVEELIPDILEDGGASRQHYNRSIRDLTWLEENGQCMDNINVGDSTVLDAGRGAFANRFIPKGGLVAPAPLVHVPNYNALKIFKTKLGDNGEVVPDRDRPFLFQLLLNYCFGHEQSTLVLCPYGLLTAWINHSPEPNARIQWSKEMRHPDWLERPFSEWGHEYHTGLQIDFVALRDIEEGEEIFIDYGTAWQEAWDRHVETFVPRGPNYLPSYELNKLDPATIDFRTIHDRDYLLDGVRLVCNWWYIRQFVPDHETRDSECQILKKLDNGNYQAQLVENFTEDGRSKKWLGPILWSIPPDAFYFEDLPYTRDHYQWGSFRHAMMIPDDMFPNAWKVATTNS
eukprot:Nitzschia sp. Nitz4//scaffold24_size164493//61516//63539//NITZ4_002322-RA/size164493-snap-gene-0.4-mRNA-1//1//CDS//3329544096//1267//frame0